MKIVQVMSKGGHKRLNKTIADVEVFKGHTKGEGFTLAIRDGEGRLYYTKLTYRDLLDMLDAIPDHEAIERLGDAERAGRWLRDTAELLGK